MAKVILICGKLCSGKTTYTQALLSREDGVLLSSDELMHALYHHQEGPQHDQLARDAQAYLYKKAAQIARAGCTVVLDWGFWTRAMRREASAYFEGQGVAYEWHYLDIADNAWRANIDSRNRAVREGRTTDYYVDEGLLQKMLSRFEPPTREEMDVWRACERENG